MLTIGWLLPSEVYLIYRFFFAVENGSGGDRGGDDFIHRAGDDLGGIVPAAEVGLGDKDTGARAVYDVLFGFVLRAPKGAEVWRNSLDLYFRELQ